MIYPISLVPSDDRIDVILHRDNLLKNLDALELTLSVYPITTEITADQVTIDPYEDYISEISQNRRSTYQPLLSSRNKIFGFGLGVLIALIFWIFNPASLWSVEGIVSVFAAYSVGKELWHDLEEWLIAITKNFPLRWSEPDYFYKRQDFGIVQMFWQLARKVRYGYQISLPAKINFFHHSNSQTIDMYFSNADLKRASELSVRIASITIAKKSLTNLLAQTMISFKISEIKKQTIFAQKNEIYQALFKGEPGVADQKNNWNAGKAISRKAISCGGIEWHGNEFAITSQLINVENK